MLKKGDTITYVAQSYGNSETVGKVDDTTVFVPYLIVGERAQAVVNYAKGNVAYADATSLLDASTKRVQPQCPHFTKCGGCSLLHMCYDEQLLFKHNKVQSNISKIAKLDVDVLPTVRSPLQFGYRNKLSLPVGGVVGNVVIGMYQRNSHNVVDIGNCILGGSWAQQVVAVAKSYLDDNKVVPYDENTFLGEIRHVVARFVDNQLLVTIVSNGAFRHDLAPLFEALQRQFGEKNVGLFVNINTNKNNVILGKTTQHVGGLSHISGTHLGVKFQLQPTSFFQVNDEVKNAIYSKVKQLLNTSQTQVLVELFSGVGILTCALANKSYQTVAVEIEPSAVADANSLAKLNGIDTITNICGDANVQLPLILQQYKGKKMSLVVDPPRKGLGQNICDLILQSDFDNIVYVSCDSATLARDLLQLQSKYNVSYVQPYDMFPNTDQVETLLYLVRK